MMELLITDNGVVHAQVLQHLPERLAGVEQPVGFLEFFDDLLGTVTNTLLA